MPLYETLAEWAMKDYEASALRMGLLWRNAKLPSDFHSSVKSLLLFIFCLLNLWACDL